jgi:hypothetical protein
MLLSLSFLLEFIDIRESLGKHLAALVHSKWVVLCGAKTQTGNRLVLLLLLLLL